jgi:hypothetical protein
MATKKVLIASILVLALVGCGGSNSGSNPLFQRLSGDYLLTLGVLSNTFDVTVSPRGVVTGQGTIDGIDATIVDGLVTQDGYCSFVLQGADSSLFRLPLCGQLRNSEGGGAVGTMTSSPSRQSVPGYFARFARRGSEE